MNAGKCVASKSPHNNYRKEQQFVVILFINGDESHPYERDNECSKREYAKAKVLIKSSAKNEVKGISGY
ncbi:hypothetical protein V5007_24860 [Klebsiella pneumoniae]|uniref:hypothetical protein n=1 Tax=Klebsiella pneumoniae TaxID=573 RepID=UPI003076165D|nr:hypothetical protein [Klebsiella pneumoniae]HDK5481242.1 hypothetical protein [Klebsiella pneumoniae]